MGQYNIECAISGLSAAVQHKDTIKTRELEAIILLHWTHDRMIPISLPVRGEYDLQGSLQNLQLNPIVERVHQELFQLQERGIFEGMTSDSSATWQPSTHSKIVGTTNTYEGLIYQTYFQNDFNSTFGGSKLDCFLALPRMIDAACHTVTHSNLPQWQEFKRIEQTPTPRLIERLYGNVPPIYSIMMLLHQVFGKDKTLRALLLRTLRLHAFFGEKKWPTRKEDTQQQITRKEDKKLAEQAWERLGHWPDFRRALRKYHRSLHKDLLEPINAKSTSNNHEEPYAELRNLLTLSPSTPLKGQSQQWTALVDRLQQWEASDRIEAIQYAEEHLADWPAQQRYTTLTINQISDPCWALCRAGDRFAHDIEAGTSIPDAWKKVTITGCVEWSDLQALQTSNNIEHLVLKACSSLKTIKTLANWTQLHSLELYQCYSIESLAGIEALPLRHLVLSDCSSLHEAFQHIQRLPNLETLTLLRCKFPSLETFPLIPLLHTLKLENCTIPNGLDGLARYAQLKHLRICHLETPAPWRPRETTQAEPSIASQGYTLLGTASFPTLSTLQITYSEPRSSNDINYQESMAILRSTKLPELRDCILQSRKYSKEERENIEWECLAKHFAPTQIKDYNISIRFERGDVLQHRTFGLGYVEKIDGEKIQVKFKGMVKTLVHNK